MNEDTCRISVCVTLEEKQKMLEAASRDDRTLSMWAVRALRVALEKSPSATVAQPCVKLAPPEPVKPAPVAPKPRPAPAPWVNPAVPGSPCEHMYSPPKPDPEDSQYDCPPVETMEEFQEKLRTGEIKLEGPSAEELDKLEKMRAIGAAIDTN